MRRHLLPCARCHCHIVIKPSHQHPLRACGVSSASSRYIFKMWSSVSRLMQKLLIQTGCHKQVCQVLWINAVWCSVCYLLRVYWHFLQVLFLFCLSLLYVSSLLLSSSLLFIYTYPVSHIDLLSVWHKSSPSLPLFFSLSSSQILKCSDSYAFKCHKWKALLFLLLTHTPKHFFFYLSLHLSMTGWDSSAVWAECLSRIWPQRCCCTADLCVRLSHSLKMWFLCKIWWHYLISSWFV